MLAWLALWLTLLAASPVPPGARVIGIFPAQCPDGAVVFATDYDVTGDGDVDLREWTTPAGVPLAWLRYGPASEAPLALLVPGPQGVIEHPAPRSEALLRAVCGPRPTVL